MKITGTSATTSLGAGQGARRAQGGFTVGGPAGGGSASAAARAGATGSIGSLDALLALQETGGPLERRRRAVRRADRVLDQLDSLRLALIDGAPSPAVLEQLRRVGREQRAPTEDAGLEALLDQVDLRAAVELAKLETRRAA